jgi:hypothetical protein
MTNYLDGEWFNAGDVSNAKYNCGYCDSRVAPSFGYVLHKNNTYPAWEVAYIYICPNCNRPTFIDEEENQFPGEKMGSKVEHLPANIEELYNEARNCFAVNAYSSSVLACRKLLMNIANTKGADSGKTFAFYVDYLKTNHHIPSGSEAWVDIIRQKGNYATHEIPNVTKEDAEEMLKFTELLLRVVYEAPGNMARYTQS